LLNEAAARQRRGQQLAGVFYAQQQNITVRQTIDDLALVAKAGEPQELENRVAYLPLR